MPPNPPTWDDLTSGYAMRPKRPTPRHRAENPLRARATTTLAAARQTARDALTAAIHGTGTPAGGLTLLAGLQQSQRRTS
jgi:hypothetical protein